MLFHSTDDVAFGVPDGTVFLSDGLESKLNNDELVAVLAHLLGHEAYGHDRAFWTEAGLIEKSAAVVGETILIVGAALVLSASPNSMPGNLLLPQPVPSTASSHPNNYAVAVHTDYSRKQEIEANLMAVQYLHDIGMPPDTLFDSLIKIRPLPLGSVHHAGVGAADLGKMLDTGMIQFSSINSVNR